MDPADNIHAKVTVCISTTTPVAPSPTVYPGAVHAPMCSLCPGPSHLTLVIPIFCRYGAAETVANGAAVSKVITL